MALYRPIPFIHHQLEKHLSPSSLVVDATVGNGHDSEYITSLLGYRGQLFGFDIQEAAITATAEKVKNANCRTTLFHKSHAEMFTTLSHFAERIDCVIFNLGFLPHHDETVTTLLPSTYSAILQALCLLRKKGLLLIVTYPGHGAGKTEFDVLEHLFKFADTKKFYITSYAQVNDCNNPPIVYCIEKK